MFATVNGARLFFDVEGAGLAPLGPLMLPKEACFVLHGGPGMDHSYFRPWLSPLADNLQLVFVDHRGTGRSQRVPLETCTIEQMADDVDALREHLGLERIVVLGNSFGGMWALVYALRYPERVSRLILVSTAASHEFGSSSAAELERRGTPEQQATSASLFEGRVTTEEEFARWWSIMLPLYFRHWDPTVGEEMIQRGIDSPQVAAYMFEQVIPRYDVRPHLGELTMPTLVVAGRHDWVTPVVESEAIAAGIPGSRLTVFEESGHLPFIEEQEAFVETVRAFLL